MSDGRDLIRDGIAAAQMREYDRARELLHAAIAEHDSDATVWYWLAIASSSAEEAVPHLRRALEISPDHAESRDALARMLLAQAGAVAGSDRAAARRLATEASQFAPEAPWVWSALAAMTDDPTERLNAIRQASALNPSDQELRAKLRQALVYRGSMIASSARVEAKRLFEEAVAIDPTDARIREWLAHLSDSVAEAIASLRELIRVVPTHERGRAALKRVLAGDARTLAQAGQRDEAAARWREATSIDAEDPLAWVGLASTASDPAEAREAAARAHRLDPQNPQIAALAARLNPPQAEAPAASAAPAAPAPVPGAEAAPAKPAAAAQSDQGASNGRRTVMVVDDSPTIRKILGLTLERAGYQVVSEADGESAVQRLAQFVPDLILLDISMPKLDGYEVCKRIKNDPRTANVPVVMLSGKDALFDKIKGKLAGATEYLTKPFETPAVLAVVTTHCAPRAEHVHG